MPFLKRIKLYHFTPTLPIYVALSHCCNNGRVLQHGTQRDGHGVPGAATSANTRRDDAGAGSHAAGATGDQRSVLMLNEFSFFLSVSLMMYHLSIAVTYVIGLSPPQALLMRQRQVEQGIADDEKQLQALRSHTVA